MVRELRVAARYLRKSPAYTSAAFLTLALGVGANTAVFSIVKTVLLDPLPYADVDHLISIAEAAPVTPNNPTIDYRTARDLRMRSRSFERLSAYRDGPGLLSEDGVSEMLRGLSVDYDFFDTLGVQMELGRNFLPSDQQAGRRTVLILSHQLWVRRFGADKHILGRVLQISVYRATVVGILPPGFQPLLKATSELDPEMYYPLPEDRFTGTGDVYLIGRLRRGASLAWARVETAGLLESIVREDPTPYPSGARLTLVPLRDRLLGGARQALWAVWAAVALVLLIACANVAQLSLARGTARSREMAVRAALGAGRFRLFWQVLAEGLLLACSGGLLGVALALIVTPVLAAAAWQIPRARLAHVDAPTLLFAVAASATSLLLFGAAPAWRTSQFDLNIALKGTGTSGRTRLRARGALAVGAVALAFVLTVAAGLMVRTFWHLMSVGAGFDPHNVLTLTTCVVSPRYAGNRIGYYREALERLRAVPGIEDAAMTSLIPMDYTDRQSVYRSDRPPPDAADVRQADPFSVSTDYFRVMRIPLNRGRVFTGQDTETTPGVAVINDTCARSLFPGEDPIDKQIRLGDGARWLNIIGVVGDVRQDGLDRTVDMQVYTDLNQEAVTGSYRLLARTRGDPLHLEHAVRGVFQTLDPGSPIYHVKPLEAYFSRRLAGRTFALVLLVGLGLLALALAATGIYGVMNYGVTLRTRELGIRMALGAGRRSVVTMVLRESVELAGLGLAFGLTAAWLVTRLLRTLLFEVGPTDLDTMATTAAVLLSAALLAGYIPARRVANVDPIQSLHSD